MATFQVFSGGPGSTQGSLDWALPPTGWPQGRLTEKQYEDSEWWHRRFRGFHPSEGSDPLQSVHTIKEFLNLWMRPDMRSTQQILDQLVLEKFMTCMPLELQVLVRERKVQSCEELEALLRKKEKPRKWRVLTIQGQEYLLENSDEDLVLDLSVKSSAPISEAGAHPENGPGVLGGPENQPGPSDVVGGQGQQVLLPETIPTNSDLQGVRPTVRSEEVEEDVMEEEEEAAVLTPPDALLPSSPGDSVMTEGEQSPQEGIGLEHVGAPDEHPTHVPEVLNRRRKRRGPRTPRGAPKRKRGNTPTVQAEPQEAAAPSDQGQVVGQRGSDSVGASNTEEPAGHPVGTEPGRQIPNECEDCHKRFSSKSQLDLHRRTHTGEGHFQCLFCPKRFPQAWDLRVHHRTHKGQKPIRFYRPHREVHPGVHAVWPPAGPHPGGAVPVGHLPPEGQPQREPQRPHVHPLGPEALPVSPVQRGLPPTGDISTPPNGMSTRQSGGSTSLL
ncbi:unnamed protein product, partial [Pipistrellus nathusii]